MWDARDRPGEPSIRGAHVDGRMGEARREGMTREHRPGPMSPAKFSRRLERARSSRPAPCDNHILANNGGGAEHYEQYFCTLNFPTAFAAIGPAHTMAQNQIKIPKGKGTVVKIH